MSALLIAFVVVHDEARYAAEYAPAMAACLAPFGGRYLAQRADLHIREGRFPAGKVVLIEFPDLANAEAWYRSSAYAPLLQVRRDTAETSLGFIVAGVAPDIHMNKGVD